ncbi:hypothetical protein HNP48_005632 [Acidovorax soli]|jgi:hypothetical protein|uniref:Uncharacterized protein n=1 Tax=Acidovorax soli TaxID=592050 RepID=A0A7X0PJ46_9BURK|nr:hypothetical protein [Acidovorax soli]MBB6562915.1 hypothetical protein [Acidovorax soli]
MSAINGIGGVTPMNIQGMDLETAMMAVQSNRANLLETQLKDQIASVQAKNDQIAKLNQALGLMNAIAAKMPSDAKAGDKITNAISANDYAAEKQLNSALDAAGIRPFPMSGNNGSGGRTEAWNNNSNKNSTADTTNANGSVTKSSWYPGGVNGSTTKGELDGAIQQMKSQIDSMSNSQQMDMLRLQSLSNKRNEAFDLMTNFIKKMQENRSSIIGNMR